MSLLDNLSSTVTSEARTAGATIQPLTHRVQADAPPNISPFFLKDIADARDQSPEQVRIGLPGDIHVSALIGFCPRQHALLLRHAGPQSQPILKSPHGGDRIVWAMGRAAEHHVRSQIIADRRDRVFGIWVCPCTETRHRGFYPKDVTCTHCRKAPSTYREYALRDAEARVVGNPDLLINERGWIIVTEVKSINKEEWKKLTRPKPDHVFQAGWYNRLLHQKGFQVHPLARVFYVCKDYIFGSPYKEYAFDATAPAITAEVLRSRDMAIHAHALAGDPTLALPARLGPCSSPSTGTAKACPAMVACFS